MISICPYTWKKRCMNLHSFSAANAHHLLHLFFVDQAISKSNYVETQFLVSARTEHPVEKTCLERGLLIGLLYNLDIWTALKQSLLSCFSIAILHLLILHSPKYRHHLVAMYPANSCVSKQIAFISQIKIFVAWCMRRCCSYSFCPQGPLESTQIKVPCCCFKQNRKTGLPNTSQR